MRDMHNIGMEQALLSSLVFEPQLFEDLDIRVDIFYLPSHQAIFSSMGILTSRNIPIDEEFLKSELVKQKAFDETVMLSILSATPVANVQPYIDALKEYSRLRKLHTLQIDIQKSLSEEGESSEDIVSSVDEQLSLLDEISDINMPIDMNLAIDEFRNMKPPVLIKTGIENIDHIFKGGLETSQFIHFGGASNTGKTTLTKQILKNVANEHKVLFFSFEMPKWKIAKQLQDKEFKKENYFITDSRMMGSDIVDVTNIIRRMHRKHDVKFIVLDSKMKITNNHYKGFSQSDKIAEIDSKLARLCQELNIVIFIITQLSKEDQRQGTMSGYGSGMSDYEADMKVMISFMDDDKGDTQRVVEVMKNRQDVLHVPATVRLDLMTMEFVSDKTYVPTTYETIPRGAEVTEYNEEPNDKLDMPGGFL